MFDFSCNKKEIEKDIIAKGDKRKKKDYYHFDELVDYSVYSTKFSDYDLLCNFLKSKWKPLPFIRYVEKNLNIIIG